MQVERMNLGKWMGFYSSISSSNYITGKVIDIFNTHVIDISCSYTAPFYGYELILTYI